MIPAGVRSFAFPKSIPSLVTPSSPPPLPFIEFSSLDQVLACLTPSPLFSPFLYEEPFSFSFPPSWFVAGALRRLRAFSKVPSFPPPPFFIRRPSPFFFRCARPQTCVFSPYLERFFFSPLRPVLNRYDMDILFIFSLPLFHRNCIGSLPLSYGCSPTSVPEPFPRHHSFNPHPH